MNPKKRDRIAAMLQNSETERGWTFTRAFREIDSLPASCATLPAETLRDVILWKARDLTLARLDGDARGQAIGFDGKARFEQIERFARHATRKTKWSFETLREFAHACNGEGEAWQAVNLSSRSGKSLMECLEAILTVKSIEREEEIQSGQKWVADTHNFDDESPIQPSPTKRRYTHSIKPGQFRIRPNPEAEASHLAVMEQQKADLAKGKFSVRWSQARCGYVIYSGRYYVPGLETFTTKQEAWEWLKETHNIEKP